MREVMLTVKEILDLLKIRCYMLFFKTKNLL
jgi:hypothetical protein